MASSSKNEDSLPKVIICGITEQNIPKLIICDEEKKPKRSCAARLCKDDEEEETGGSLCYPQTCYPPPPCPPPSCSPPSCGPPQCMSPEQKNAMLRNMQDQLMCEIQLKQQTIADLQKNLYTLECEKDFLSKENAKLCEKFQQVCPSQQSVSASRKGSRCKDLSCVQSKLEGYDESTKLLEQQVCEMENSVKAMRNELMEVQAEREKLNKNKKIYMVLPPPVCPSCPPPNCDGWEKKPSCPLRPRRCSFKGNVSQRKIKLPSDQNSHQKSGTLTSVLRGFFNI